MGWARAQCIPVPLGEREKNIQPSRCCALALQRCICVTHTHASAHIHAHAVVFSLDLTEHMFVLSACSPAAALVRCAMRCPSPSAQADALVAKAEKKLKGWGFMGNKYEDAQDLLEKAANLYKVSKACTSSRRRHALSSHTHTHTHTRARAHTHTRTHTHIRARAHTQTHKEVLVHNTKQPVAAFCLQSFGLGITNLEHSSATFPPVRSSFSLSPGGKAAATFEKLSEIYVKLDSKHEAAQAYVDAANAYKKVRPPFILPPSKSCADPTTPPFPLSLWE